MFTHAIMLPSQCCRTATITDVTFQQLDQKTVTMASTAAQIERQAILTTKGKATPLKGWKGPTGSSTCVATIALRRD